MTTTATETISPICDECGFEEHNCQCCSICCEADHDEDDCPSSAY